MPGRRAQPAGGTWLAAVQASRVCCLAGATAGCEVSPCSNAAKQQGCGCCSGCSRCSSSSRCSSPCSSRCSSPCSSSQQQQQRHQSQPCTQHARQAAARQQQLAGAPPGLSATCRLGAEPKNMPAAAKRSNRAGCSSSWRCCSAFTGTAPASAQGGQCAAAQLQHQWQLVGRHVEHTRAITPCCRHIKRHRAWRLVNMTAVSATAHATHWLPLQACYTSMHSGHLKGGKVCQGDDLSNIQIKCILGSM
ncbi:hypothetical protein COO60DRAFT_84612 [Scenedesmus sp. NREL 46B-D3]|nr:hypothetical protein COO60DRAFT_84612 [Scenedesmus sp. NREL 46B-D3]